tara:strand:+ start:345 stop:521 length:177 start_codon:yes stop_codon:yes gene_type:complete
MDKNAIGPQKFSNICDPPNKLKTELVSIAKKEKKLLKRDIFLCYNKKKPSRENFFHPK